MEATDTVVVTGATKGLGRALAVEISKLGRHVVAVGRNEDELATLAAQPVDGRITTVRADLSTRPGLDAAIDAIKTATDGTAAVLVNNAGVQYFAPVDEFTLDQFEETLFVNTLVPFALSRALLPELARTSGTIVNIASDLAYRPMEFGSAYVASKAGLAAMSQVFQEEVRDRGVRVTVVEPGYIATGEYGAQRAKKDHMDPAALAQLLTWLLETPAGIRVDRLTIHPMIQGTWGDISFPNMDDFLN
jgi:NAD(P)-dependent dehydrogenase (short-subunit alcohol dehydrogenase family)